MTHTRNFFHDRFILFFLTINSFLMLVSLVVVLFRLSGGAQGSYIQSYRSNLGLSAITVGGIGEILAFLIFAVGLFTVSIFLGIQFYKIRKASSWVVMVMTTLLLILNLIVVNALLDLR